MSVLQPQGVRKGRGGLSRSTNENIQDVFRRGGDGSMPLRHAIEELIARSPTVELANGVSMPTTSLLDHVNDQEVVNKTDFLGFVSSRLQSAAGRGDSMQATRYVSAREYVMQCVRCESGQADDFGVTRYWSGVPRFDPRLSLSVVVIVTTVLAMGCIMGVLFGIVLPQSLAVNDSTTRALAQSTQAAVSAVVGSELPAELNSMHSVAGSCPNTIYNTYSQAYALALIAAVNEVNLLLNDANHLYSTSRLSRVGQLNVSMQTLIEASTAMNIDGSTMRSIIGAWVAQGASKLRGAMWFDVSSGDSVPRTVLGSWGAASCGTTATTSLCTQMSRVSSLVRTATNHDVVSVWSNVTSPAITNAWFNMICTQIISDGAFYSNTVLCGVEINVRFDDVVIPPAALTFGSAMACNLAVSNATGLWYQSSLSSRGTYALSSAPSDLSQRATDNAGKGQLVAANNAVVVQAASSTAYCNGGTQSSSMPVTCTAYAECVWNVTQLTIDGTNRFNTIYGSGFKVTITVWSTSAQIYVPLDGSVQPDPVWSPQYQMSQSASTPYGTTTALNEVGLPTVAAFAKIQNTPFGVVVETLPDVSLISSSASLSLVQMLSVTLSSGHSIVGFVDTTDEGLRVVDPATGLPDVTRPTMPMAVNRAAAVTFYRRRRTTLSSGGYAATAVYIPEINAVIVAYTDSVDTTLTFMSYVGYSCIAAVVLLVMVIVVLERVARMVLDVAQVDASGTKQAEAEHSAELSFGAVLQDAMPPMYLERFKNGEKLMSDFHPTLTFFFSDIVKFTEKSKFMSMIDLVRFLGYTFWLLDTVAEHYDIHKIKSIGDAYFAVSGLEDAENRRRNGGNVVTLAQNHQTYRMLAFGSVCQMLLTQNFFHVPEKTEFFASATGTSPSTATALKPPLIRIGIHVGSAYAGVFDAGRAPQFDCIAPAIGVCAMLEAAALPGTIRISEQCRKLLNQIDTQKDFICSEPQKTLAKNQGRVETYTIVATFIGVPQAILETLNVTRSVKKRVFGDGGFQLDEVDKGFKEMGVFGDFEQSQMQSEGSEGQAEEEE